MGYQQKFIVALLICTLFIVICLYTGSSNWHRLTSTRSGSGATLQLLNYSLDYTLPTKRIFVPAKLEGYFLDEYFKNCQFSNCTFMFSDNFEELTKAHLVIIEFNSAQLDAVASAMTHLRQPLLVFSHESPGYKHNRWSRAANKVDGIMTYLLSSPVYYSWGVRTELSAHKSQTFHLPNYAEDKAKGGYAYVSNCHSVHYDRLYTMKRLSKFIDVDIYGGCTGDVPCNRGDSECESTLHSKYRFYFAFENSLCKEYISEKFWKTLSSSAHLVPVALGGLSVDEYTTIAPPDSFIHAYNFSSIDQLGEYLRHLMEDDAAYNRYHQWRAAYTVEIRPIRASCDLCNLAHNPNKLNSSHKVDVDRDWNNACMKLDSSFFSNASKRAAPNSLYFCMVFVLLYHKYQKLR